MICRSMSRLEFYDRSGGVSNPSKDEKRGSSYNINHTVVLHCPCRGISRTLDCPHCFFFPFRHIGREWTATCLSIPFSVRIKAIWLIAGLSPAVPHVEVRGLSLVLLWGTDVGVVRYHMYHTLGLWSIGWPLWAIWGGSGSAQGRCIADGYHQSWGGWVGVAHSGSSGIYYHLDVRHQVC